MVVSLDHVWRRVAFLIATSLLDAEILRRRVEGAFQVQQP